MKIKIDFTKSAQENADIFYNKSKRLAKKRLGAQEAIKQLEKRMKNAQSLSIAKEERIVVKKQESEWYEKFRWSFTSNHMLVIGGRDAQQNELINSRHFEDNDLFFHADIFGASVTVLKNGADSSKEIREEVAQLAACYSSAWKDMLHSVDVYAMKRNQVSKSRSKGSLATGSFLLSGEREWFRNTQLSLVLFVKGDKINVASEKSFYKMKENGVSFGRHVLVKQGNVKKSDVAKKISKELNFNDIDSIMQQLPSGEFKIS